MCWTTILTTPANYTAFSAVVGMLLALYAANAWRRTLQYQRCDDCVGTLYEVKGALNRLIALSGRDDISKEFRGLAYDDAWKAWRAFAKAHAIARRYRVAIPLDSPDRLVKLFDEVASKYQSEDGFSVSDKEKVNAEIVRVISCVINHLPLARIY